MIRVHSVGRILLKGMGIGHKIATGTVCRISTPGEMADKFKPGCILVVRTLDEDMAPYAVKAMAIIAEEGGLTSQAAIVGVSYGIPVIVGVDGALDQLEDGMKITTDTERGLIYQGEIHAR